MNNKKCLSLAASLLLSIAVVPYGAARAEDVTAVTTTTAPKASLAYFDEKEMTKGEKYTINIKGDQLEFSSDNSNVAVVSSTGIIEAVGYGTAIVSVTNSNNDIVQLKVTVSAFVPSKVFGDINSDNIIDSRDATTLLAYYAKTSTGYKGSLKDYMLELDGVNPASDIRSTIVQPSDIEPIVRAGRQEWVTGYYDVEGEWHFYPGYGD